MSPHLQDPWPKKLGSVLTQDKAAAPTKPCDTSMLQSHDNSKTSYLSQPQSLSPQNLAGCWLFCGYYDKGLRRRKLANPSITLFPSFVRKSIYQM